MKERSKKLIDIIFCIILLIFLLSLMFSLLFSKEKSFSEKENRVLKTRPSVKIYRILDGRFFSEFSKYCADQFPFRESFTGISSFIDLSLGRIEANGIIVINNKVLIPRNDYSNNQILHDNLKTIATFIESNKSNGLPSYIVVAPRSLDVNKEKLPICFSTDYGTAEYDALYNTIKKQNLIDTLPCLTKNVKEKNFYNTDHHWTTHGAYIAYLEITHPRELSHRDFLGSLMSLGIKRELIGDILVGQNKSYIVVQKSFCEHIIDSLTKIGNVGVVIKECSKDSVVLLENRFEECRAIVSSLRIDCVVAALCNKSRAESAKLVEGERVNVNHEIITSCSKNIDMDDIVSVRSFGKFKIGKCISTTKKGRLVLSYKKYI